MTHINRMDIALLAAILSIAITGLIGMLSVESAIKQLVEEVSALTVCGCHAQEVTP